jgi:hypothetical protein
MFLKSIETMAAVIPGIGNPGKVYPGIYPGCTIPTVYTGIWARVVDDFSKMVRIEPWVAQSS